MTRGSVCTLAHGREAHLANLVRGLDASETAPAELVVAVLDHRPYDLPRSAVPVRQIVMGDAGIALARARNAAASAATGELLVFLDVDCIPHPALVGDYLAAFRTHRGVMMGEVGYLPRGATDGDLDADRLDALAVRHSERPGPPADRVGACSDYRCFWSLNFAMLRADFDKVGGFDESYSGYGGEDTDFGRSCFEAGIPLWWVRGARAWHQYHPHHMPPVHHLDSVLANAERFREKWGTPTMQHWLRAFRLMGLAEPRAGRWTKLREPSDADLAFTRQQEHEPYASSARVLAALEASAPMDSVPAIARA
jgi:GT2 family glycosyltransferase